jgi:outer membrane protein assembly factor BamB
VAGYVFISYSHDDGEYVDRLKRHLADAGLIVWTDRGIDYGSQWSATIATQLDGCAVFVPVMSPRSRRSAWVRKEILYAQENSKTILPLLLDGSRFLELIDVQDEAVPDGRLPSARFIDRIRTLVGQERPVQVEPEPVGPNVVSQAGASYRDSVPIPELHVSEQERADLGSQPIFPNPAVVAGAQLSGSTVGMTVDAGPVPTALAPSASSESHTAQPVPEEPTAVKPAPRVSREVIPWRFYLGGTAPAPAYADGRVIVTGGADQVVALDLISGRPLWQGRFPLLHGVAPVVLGDTALVAGSDNYLRLLSLETGSLLHLYELTAPPTAPPTVAGELIVVPTADAHLVALGRGSGKQIFRRKLSQPVHSAVVASRDVLYVAGHDCHVRAWSTDGTERWSFRSRKWFDASPLVVDSLFIGGYDGRLHQLSLGTGQPRGYFQAGDRIKGTAAVGSNTVVFGCYNGALYALDTTTLDLRWTYPTGPAPLRAAPIIHGNSVYVAGRDGVTHAIALRNGIPRWRYRTGGAVNVTPMIAGPFLVVGADDGNVYALDTQDGRGPAPEPTV